MKTAYAHRVLRRKRSAREIEKGRSIQQPVQPHMMRPLSICKKKKSKEKAGRIKRLDHPHIRGLDTKRSMVRLEKSVLPENRNQKRVNESVLTVESTMT